MNEVTNLIAEGLELLPSVKNAKSPNYARLVEIYSTINKVQVNCSPCIYYTVVSYFEAFNKNTTYQTKTMAATKYKVLPDSKGNERTSFMFKGATYPVELITDAVIEKMLRSGSFYIGVHFEILDELQTNDGEFVVANGDTSKEIQEPIEPKLVTVFTLPDEQPQPTETKATVKRGRGKKQ